jgi:hypothetical protein
MEADQTWYEVIGEIREVLDTFGEGNAAASAKSASEARRLGAWEFLAALAAANKDQGSSSSVWVGDPRLPTLRALMGAPTAMSQYLSVAIAAGLVNLASQSTGRSATEILDELAGNWPGTRLSARCKGGDHGLCGHWVGLEATGTGIVLCTCDCHSSCPLAGRLSVPGEQWESECECPGSGELKTALAQSREKNQVR